MSQARVVWSRSLVCSITTAGDSAVVTSKTRTVAPSRNTACLTAIGVATAADAVALHYGSRSSGGLLDAWLLSEEDAALAPAVEAAGIRASVVPLWMRDIPTSAAIAAASLAAASIT